MEPTEIAKLLLEAPMTLLLFYFLIKEQKEHAETRRLRDADAARYQERAFGMAERVVAAVEKLEDKASILTR